MVMKAIRTSFYIETKHLFIWPVLMGGTHNPHLSVGLSRASLLILEKAVTVRPEQESPHLVTTVIG